MSHQDLRLRARGGVFLYFAYGSNMLTARLRARTPSARFVQIGHVPGRKLTFEKISLDGSGKCDISEADDASSVHGVVFELDTEELAELDRVEELGEGYDRLEVTVMTEAGALRAETYFALKRDPRQQPFHWYKELVLAGAREHDLPSRHIEVIGGVVSIPDPDRARAARNVALLPTGASGRQAEQ